jgi:hypothetical protein
LKRIGAGVALQRFELNWHKRNGGSGEERRNGGPEGRWDSGTEIDGADRVPTA